MFRRKKWRYLILDEAHMIKNWKSMRWQTLLNFNSARRLLITGALRDGRLSTTILQILMLWTSRSLLGQQRWCARDLHVSYSESYFDP